MGRPSRRHVIDLKAIPALIVVLLIIFFSHAGATDPTAIIDGLAVYRIGEEEPVFLMPYPHASTLESTASSELASILIDIGRSVITFDPPGIFESTRPPECDMEEMLRCTYETMEHFDLSDNIDFIGHSMGSFCVLAFSVEHPERVKRLVLIGSTSGWRSVRKWGIHKHWKWWKDSEFWQCRIWGTRIMLGLDNLKIHKKLDHIVDRASFVEEVYVTPLRIGKKDRKQPAPVRSVWMRILRKHRLDYSERLQDIRVPVLLCVGRYDPQTPVIMSEELHLGLPESDLIVFEDSGHSPFIEERETFMNAIARFLGDEN